MSAIRGLMPVVNEQSAFTDGTRSSSPDMSARRMRVRLSWSVWSWSTPVELRMRVATVEDIGELVSE